MARGKIEDMPIGALLLGYYTDAAGAVININDAGVYLGRVLVGNFSIKPSRIEVHDDTITLISSVGFKSGRPTCEVNFKTGTLVEWEME